MLYSYISCTSNEGQSILTLSFVNEGSVVIKYVFAGVVASVNRITVTERIKAQFLVCGASCS